MLPIERGPNGESTSDVENTSHFFRSGETPGSPSQYDNFEEGLMGAEESAAARPLHHPVSLTARQRRLSDQVAAALETMRPEQALVLRYRYFEGMSEEAIGQEIGVTQQAIHLRLKTAHANFMKAMQVEDEVAA